jgi:SnoaL-like domain
VSALQTLLDTDAIRKVIYRYCRGIDRMDRAEVRQCYHDDGYEVHGGSFEGDIEAYLDWVWKMLEKYSCTQHLVCNILVDLRGSVAVAESCSVAVHIGRDERPQNNLMTGFRYVDRFERRNGEWRIVRRVAIAEWSKVGRVEDRWQLPNHLLTGRRDRGDVLYSMLDELAASSVEVTP